MDNVLIFEDDCVVKIVELLFVKSQQIKDKYYFNGCRETKDNQDYKNTTIRKQLCKLTHNNFQDEDHLNGLCQFRNQKQIKDKRHELLRSNNRKT